MAALLKQLSVPTRFLLVSTGCSRHTPCLYSATNLAGVKSRIVDRYSTSPSSSNSKNPYASVPFQTIFLVKPIKFLMVKSLHKTKVRSLVAAAAVAPLHYAAFHYGYTDVEAIATFYACIGLFTANVWVLSSVIGETVLRLNLSEDRKVLKVVYLDNWGNIKDKFFKAGNVVPITLLATPFRLRFKDSEKKYTMFLGGCKVQSKVFRSLFGLM